MKTMPQAKAKTPFLEKWSSTDIMRVEQAAACGPSVWHYSFVPLL